MNTDQTNRRAVLTQGARMSAFAVCAAIVGGAVAVADAKGAELPHDAPDAAPASTTDPLEPFALAWLSRWTRHGGSVAIQPGWGFMRGWPEYDLSPDAGDQRARMIEAGVSAEETQRILDRDYASNSSNHTGKMRALSDLLDDVPGGAEAVKRLVGQERALGMPRRVELAS